MTHPNESLGREANAAFGRGDLTALQNYFAEDIRWHVPAEDLSLAITKGSLR